MARAALEIHSWTDAVGPFMVTPPRSDAERGSIKSPCSGCAWK